MRESTRRSAALFYRPSPLVAAVMLAMVMACVPAHRLLAQTVTPPGGPLGIPDFAGTGLSGLYYDDSNGMTSADGNPAAASFTTTNLCFPDCQGNSFGDGNGGLTAFGNGNINNIDIFGSGRHCATAGTIQNWISPALSRSLSPAPIISPSGLTTTHSWIFKAKARHRFWAAARRHFPTSFPPPVSMRFRFSSWNSAGQPPVLRRHGSQRQLHFRLL